MEKLNNLLNELFAKGTFSVEVCITSLQCVEASPRVILSVVETKCRKDRE